MSFGMPMHASRSLTFRCALDMMTVPPGGIPLSPGLLGVENAASHPAALALLLTVVILLLVR